MEIIRKAADPKCSSHLENTISSIDSILAIPRMSTVLKGLFGLASLQHNEDFVSVLEVSSLVFLYRSCTLTAYVNCALLGNRVHWVLGKLKIGILRLAARNLRNSAKRWENRRLVYLQLTLMLHMVTLQE